MEYAFSDIEKKWQQYWKEQGVYKVSNESDKPKFYVLDMFPYPSGAGLHVGHPLGYIASDILARYKRHKGFNVLHPMGYDAFGLPAEQYALETGQHPAVTTEQNIARYRQQLDNIGFCYDWSREVRTSDPQYYKWTQWIFLQLFHSWCNRKTQRATPITELVKIFEAEGNINHPSPTDETLQFNALGWTDMNEVAKRNVLMQYRLAYLSHAEVWWCEALGTVLANDEVVNGVSERGAHPVVKKQMNQWFLRITEFADRLLTSLDTLDWTDAMKEMQRNWIGKSTGAEVTFKLKGNNNEIKVFTTRPDTIFGVDFMVLAPEHELVDFISTPEQKEAVATYKEYVQSRSERERMADVKQITGAFTGAYAKHPFTGRDIPVWISEYVLAGYGTGAIMAVPSGDDRDHAFAKHFKISITNVFGDKYNGEEAYTEKAGTIENSEFLNGKDIKESIQLAIKEIADRGIGHAKINYKLRDAGFSRQRYWGEPFPIVYTEHTPYAIDEIDGTTYQLPVELPHVDSYKPGPEGQGPLANITEWVNLTPGPSPQVEKGDSNAQVRTSPVPKYTVASLKQFEMARQNRKNYTEAEIQLWQSLRDRQTGAKFRRQHPIEQFIVDFVSLQDALVIEIDGGYHNDEAQREYDEYRTFILKNLGFNVIRFSNEEVMGDINNVLNTINKQLALPGEQNTRAVTPSPLVESGQGGEVLRRETNTMPGYAGSSWYFLRYMDPHNAETFAGKKATDYWQAVDVYVGGTEHAVGHLLYSRLWTKVLHDLGHISFDEPFKKLINQGMIQGSSRFVYRLNASTAEHLIAGVIKELNLTGFKHQFQGIPVQADYYNEAEGIALEVSSQKLITDKYAKARENYPQVTLIYLSAEEIFSKYQAGKEYMMRWLKDLIAANENYCSRSDKHSFFISHGLLKHIGNSDVDKLHVDVQFVDGVELNIHGFRNWRPEYSDAEFILEDGKYICGAETEKMSKSKYNVVNPDDIVAQYGADTFRMYEMFLGPIDMSKPWDTKGIEGVHRFLKKMWRLYADEQQGLIVTDEAATDAEMKALHKTIKKIGDDIERFSFNTSVSQFMICVNELSSLNCHKRSILQPLAIVIAPFAPHFAEELWHLLGNEGTVVDAAYPEYEEKYVVENSKMYPVAINGKARAEMEFALDMDKAELEKQVLANETVQKWMEGKPMKKFIYVPGKMINVVV